MSASRWQMILARMFQAQMDQSSVPIGVKTTNDPDKIEIIANILRGDTQEQVNILMRNVLKDLLYFAYHEAASCGDPSSDACDDSRHMSCVIRSSRCLTQRRFSGR
jgi:hypothetical protein